jgi:hypothetical protein
MTFNLTKSEANEAARWGIPSNELGVTSGESKSRIYSLVILILSTQ